MTERMHVFMCIRVTARLIARERKKETFSCIHCLSREIIQWCLLKFKQCVSVCDSFATPIDLSVCIQMCYGNA